jgi:hypothetical protein
LGSTQKDSSGAFTSPLLLVVPILAGWVVLNAVVRRIRWAWRRRRASRAGPHGTVLSHWADVSELLAWRGAVRRSSETDDEYAHRAAGRIGRQMSEPSPWLVGGVARMAAMAREAAFAPTVPAGRPHEAAEVAAEIRQRLVRTANARQLFAWLLLPRQGIGR